MKELLQFLREPSPPKTIRPFPQMRNFVLDVLAEGRRKPLIHLQLEVDITDLRRELAQRQAKTAERVTLTGAIAAAFAAAVAEDLSVQAYRKGRRKLVVFDDVDLAVMVEREVEGAKQPLVWIVRRAQAKDAATISSELATARTAPLGEAGPLSALEATFFSWPDWARRPIWWLIHRDPNLFKELVGTVGLTSMGMHATGPALTLPISPMTLTLSIGALIERCRLSEGAHTTREVIQLNLTADHSVIDGVPLTRFGERLRSLLAHSGERDRSVRSIATGCPDGTA